MGPDPAAKSLLRFLGGLASECAPPLGPSPSSTLLRPTASYLKFRQGGSFNGKLDGSQCIHTPYAHRRHKHTDMEVGRV